MPVERITASEFADQIVTGVNDRDETLDTRIGPIRDLFIDPVSEVLENQNDRVVYLNNLLSLKNADQLVPDDVDDFVYNEAMVRWGGSSAITTLTFARAKPPTVDITVPVNFPVSTLTDPATGASIMFRTIETKTMYAASASAYYNSDTGKYELNVSIASLLQSAAGMVGAYTITQMRRPFPQFDEIYNKDATTSGRGIETNSELASRYTLHLTGSQIATPNGISRFILDNISSVEDVYVVFGNNSYLTREDTDAGAVDVWVLGSIPATRTYVTSYSSIYTLQSVDYQPVISIVSVSSVAAAATYIEGTDYEVITGEGEFAYSNLGSDGIRWLPGGAHPAIGEDVVIEYTYNSLINILTAYFTQQDFYCMGADRLFRWAQPTQLEVEASLKIRAGSPTDVANNVRNTVLAYINDLKLGENVEEFDIDSVVSKIYGVDNWVYTQLSVKGGSGVSDITIAPYNYARLEEGDFIINLV